MQEKEHVMATRTRKTNGRTNGKTNGARPAAIDTHLLHERAGQVTTTAHGIARIADAVFEGAEVQLRSLDEAVTGVNQMATSLMQTASQAESISLSADELDRRRCQCLLAGELGRDRRQVALTLRVREFVVLTPALPCIHLGAFGDDLRPGGPHDRR